MTISHSKPQWTDKVPAFHHTKFYTRKQLTWSPDNHRYLHVSQAFVELNLGLYICLWTEERKNEYITFWNNSVWMGERLLSNTLVATNYFEIVWPCRSWFSKSTGLSDIHSIIFSHLLNVYFFNHWTEYPPLCHESKAIAL